MFVTNIVHLVGIVENVFNNMGMHGMEYFRMGVAV